MNILFVCSRNQWRSLTAEKVFQGLPNVNVKSAGTENSARIRVTEKMVAWSDIVFVMEKKHKEKLIHDFGDTARAAIIITLDIADDYPYMDPDLIDVLRAGVTPYLPGK